MLPADQLITGAPVRIAETDAHEGPVYVAHEDALYFTTSRPDVEIRRLDVATGRVSTVRAAAKMANGMTLARDGRLVVCEQGTFDEPAGIAAVDRATGAREPLVTSWHGRPLNSPNDVALASDGGIWFTDPSYGWLQGFRPEPEIGDRVYRADPATGEAWVVADGLDKPNGLAFSPDEHTLYVGDSGAPHRLLAFDVHGGRRLGARRVVAKLPAEHPDGIKVDMAGRIYASSPAGVEVLAPDGERLARIHLPGAVNFAFGGAERNVLFITADTAIWAVVLNARGA